MHKLNVLALFFCILITSLQFSCPLSAISSNLMISQVKAGNSSTTRLVEIYNNSTESVDITGWCLYYSSPGNTTPYSQLGCFNGASPAYHEFVTAKSYILFASSGISGDMVLTSGLGTGTNGHVNLFDGNDNEIDRVGWGSVSNPETKSIALDSSKVIERKKDSLTGLMIDTDNNSMDFFNSVLRQQYQYGSIYEEFDVCTNIVGIQQTLPDGYSSDGSGNCAPPPVDICPNLNELQTSLPDGYLHDEDGNCIKDACLNIDGLQQTVPDGRKLRGDNECIVSLLPLRITEMLPNASGNDNGNEFIEIFNPNGIDISMNSYILHIYSTNKDLLFPANFNIGAGKYASFSNDEIGFTLPNTSSGVGLYSVDNELIDETPIYSNPKDGAAWALIDGMWQYTNQPTPGHANITSVIAKAKSKKMKSKLMPCASNQYRNPATNRCKLIEPSISKLVPCKEGQYRSEETNRCRSIAAVLGASILKPCKEGQERNPKTNRCRNVVKDIPGADYAPEQSKNQEYSPVWFWSFSCLGMASVGYGVWEWRREIMGIFKK